MSDLLNECVANAKAVRESALANAKTFLEENFASSVKEMFAEKLKEEMNGVEEEADTSNIGSGDNVSPSKDACDNTVSAGKQEFNLEEVESEEIEEITSDDLDEILAELQSDTGDTEEESDEVSEGEKLDLSGLEESDIPEDDLEEINLDELLAELESEEGASEEPPLDQDKTPVPSPVPSPEPSPESEQGSVPSPMDEENVTAEEMAEALITINEENEELKEKMGEYEKTIKYLKGVMNETNLLNAKLLYTNKLFKGSLSEGQKLKVINTFDLAKNIREVKLAYTVLAESFNAGGSVVNKKKNTTAQTITEGLASKPVTSTKPEAAIVAPEASELASRLQKLAGITK